MAHPSVMEAAVVGRPDPQRTQIVVGICILAPGHEPSAALAHELQAFVREQTAPYKYPREIHFVESLPQDRQRQDPAHRDCAAGCSTAGCRRAGRAERTRPRQAQRRGLTSGAMRGGQREVDRLEFRGVAARSLEDAQPDRESMPAGQQVTAVGVKRDRDLLGLAGP